MRQIKFRAYDKARKEYLSAGKIFLTINGGKNPTDSVQYLDVLRDPNMYAGRFVIEQFTGLHDKNGKEIWEGDIFKEDNSGIVRSVFWVPGGLAFEDNPVSFGYDHRAPVYPYSSIAEMQNASWLSQCCEIIGNIHDNPDLLK